MTISPKINKAIIRDAFHDAYLCEEEMPDVLGAIMRLIEDEINELRDELEDDWNEDRFQYLQEVKDWDQHVRDHAPGKI
jgi:hypothetical protein